MTGPSSATQDCEVPEKQGIASQWATYRPRALAQPRPVGLEIRPAKATECAVVAEIEASRDGVDVDRAQRRCEAQATDPEVLLLVASVDGQIVGFARASRVRGPSNPPPETIPDGWYLQGVIVLDAWRRRGVGHALTDARLDWIAHRADAAYYFANARNRSSLDLHAAIGFVEVTRRFSIPGVTFEGGEGVLCRIDLSGSVRGTPREPNCTDLS